MKQFSRFIVVWLLSLAVCTSVVIVSFAHIDVPMALHFYKAGGALGPLGTLFGATVIVSLEAAVALGLILARLVRGHISPFAAALAVACLASICAYGINSELLKPFFGVPNPADVMEGARHAFNLMRGSENDSFPSGHMVLAASFAGVLMRLQRSTFWPLTALLVLAAGLLIVGDWHFLSDVIAGTFVGASAGILAGDLWGASSRQSPRPGSD